MKIENFNKQNLPIINQEIKNALQLVELKFGIVIKLGSTRFDADNYTTKIEVKLPTADKRKAEDSFKYADMLDLPIDIKDKQFDMNGKRFHVVELDTKKHKRPCVIQEVGKPSEKRFITTVEVVNRAVGHKSKYSS